MIPVTCLQLRNSLLEIKSLKRDFDSAVVNIKISRNTASVYALEQEIREKMGLVKGKILGESFDKAEKIFGPDFFGPQEVELAFGLKLKIENLPDVPFSPDVLVEAKKFNQILILRLDKTPAGEPLTMGKMHEIKNGQTNNQEPVLDGSDEDGQLRTGAWFRQKTFFTVHTPVLSWALVSKEAIPDSLSQDYLAQTEILVNYFQNKIFKGQQLDKAYQEAINEFNQVKKGIKESMFVKHQADIGKKLEKLTINKLLRHTPVEAMYDILVTRAKTGQSILVNRIWTNSCQPSTGELINVGENAIGQIAIGRNKSSAFEKNLGAFLSYRQ